MILHPPHLAVRKVPDSGPAAVTSTPAQGGGHCTKQGPMKAASGKTVNPSAVLVGLVGTGRGEADPLRESEGLIGQLYGLISKPTAFCRLGKHWPGSQATCPALCVFQIVLLYSPA